MISTEQALNEWGRRVEKGNGVVCDEEVCMAVWGQAMTIFHIVEMDAV